jgi:hypothetical protein
MVINNTCYYGQPRKLITIQRALRLRHKNGSFVGKCPVCGWDVKAVDGSQAHFQHLNGNKNCVQSDHNKNPKRYS